MPLRPQYAANLKRLLSATAKSAQQIAEQVGISRATIYNWRDGKGGPDEEEASHLAKALGVPVSEFWLPDEPVQPSERERLTQLESFVQEVGRLLGTVEPRAPARPPDDGMLVEATDAEAARRQRGIDKRLGKRARRDGTSR